MRLSSTVLSVLMVACCGTALHADVVLFDRGLPTTNLNNAAGANRSNVAWGDVSPSGGETWAIGDSFSLSGQSDITDLRVWIVAEDSQPPSSMWSDLTLFGGKAGSIGALSTVGTNGADPKVQISPVTYADGSTYQGSSGSFINIYQVDFLLNWLVDANTTYYFFVGGTPTATNHSIYDSLFGGAISPFLSASNALLSGSPQAGADNLVWELGSVSGPDSFSAGPPYWDKPSDINVQIIGTPEPASVFLFGTVALIAGSFVKRKYRSKQI